jgi:L-2,4-diaminobutyrate decarboxylase
MSIPLSGGAGPAHRHDRPMQLDDFLIDAHSLQRAVELLEERTPIVGLDSQIPSTLPETGVGSSTALEMLAAPLLTQSRDLAAPGFFAHMDPPTPWVTWATSMWTASRNQNLLHPDTAPAARDLESAVINWLAPFYGASGGHMTPGSTIANLTALWAAREAGAREIVASRAAHLSIEKAAHLLGLPLRIVDDWTSPGPVDSSVVVITAGTTSTGDIEPLGAAPTARWRHLDAAWAGPLRLSTRHADLLDGVETFDSIAISAHKWLFQPKESALVLFKNHEAAHRSVSVTGPYLATPNVGVLGSHGATAAPLLATLLAFGRTGIAGIIDTCMDLAVELFQLVQNDDELEAHAEPRTGVVCWRHRHLSCDAIREHLPADVFVSTTTIDGHTWLRSVAANPFAQPALVIDGVHTAASSARRRSH